MQEKMHYKGFLNRRDSGMPSPTKGGESCGKRKAAIFKQIYLNSKQRVTVISLSHTTHMNWHLWMPFSRHPTDFIAYVVSVVFFVWSFLCQMYHVLQHLPTFGVLHGILKKGISNLRSLPKIRPSSYFKCLMLICIYMQA